MCHCTIRNNNSASSRPRRLATVYADFASMSDSVETMPTKNKSQAMKDKVRPEYLPKGMTQTEVNQQQQFRYRYPSIPSDHPLKLFFDALLVLISLTAGIYKTNTSILQECFSHVIYDYCPTNKSAAASSVSSWSNVICFLIQAIYVVDIILNFVCTDNKKGADATKSKRRQVLKYMLTWFIIDALNMLPWEAMIVQPTYNYHSKRHVVFKVIDFLRACPAIKKRWHYIAKARRIARSFGYRNQLRYVHHLPKYAVFFREMKMILVVRGLQHARWTRRLLSGIRKRTYP